MENSINNMDNLLKNSFEDFSSAPIESVRAKVSAKVLKFNFFRFNIASFNVFYLVAIIIGVSTTLAIVSGVFETKNTGSKIIERKVDQIDIIEHNNSGEENASVENAIKTILTSNTIENSPSNNNNPVEKIIFTEEITQTSSHIEIENVEETDSNTEIITEFQDRNENIDIIENDNSNPIVDVSISSEIEEELPTVIIYDTIFTTNKIIVVDTIKIEVHKEIKVKKSRRNRK